MHRRKRNGEHSNFETHQRKDVSGARRAWAAAASPERIAELFTSCRCHHHIHRVTILTKDEPQPTTRSAFFRGFLHPTVTYLTSRSNIDIQLGRNLELRIPNCNCSGLCHHNSNNLLQNLNQKMERKKRNRGTRERAKDKARESERRREGARASGRDSAI
jgi:hypothetical protein